MRRKIYLASSWRNAYQPAMVERLREHHDVYDFRNPIAGDDGFSWKQCTDTNPSTWTPENYIDIVTKHPIARRGFNMDLGGMEWADTCVLLLPSGRSAHLEAGYMIGRGKKTYVLLKPEAFEPELMYLLANGIFASDGEMLLELLAR